MRSILLILLVANMALFAWWQGWLAGWPERGAGVPTELHAERLSVVPIDRLGGPPLRAVPRALPGPTPD